MKNPIQITSPAACCGCGACSNACPVDAIQMTEDSAGFLYPHVNDSLCIRCGKCADVCVFAVNGKGAHGAPTVYAAALRDREILKQSSSGGIFTALANAILDKGGVVFGAAWTDDLTVSHVCVTDTATLGKLRGSKYVQSSTGSAFRQVRQLLKAGTCVCYSGTPCQIAGLKAYLGEDYDNLLTVDIVCHGVPSMKMLRDDLSFVSGGNLSEIRDVKFRDKRYGWGTKGSFIKGGATIKYNADTSPYYFYFLKGEVYRESCYRCRFPSEGRQGDITLGDYWGIRQETIHQMGDTDPDLGVSCVLVNSEKGTEWFAQIKNTLSVAPSDRTSVEKRNKQLTQPSVPLPEHQELLEGYLQKGYSAFQSGYKTHTKDHIVRTVKNMIPSKIKRKLSERLL